VLHNDDTSMPGPGCSSPAKGWTPGRVVFPPGVRHPPYATRPLLEDRNEFGCTFSHRETAVLLSNHAE
jgi:hypothetical protein